MAGVGPDQAAHRSTNVVHNPAVLLPVQYIKQIFQHIGVVSNIDVKELLIFSW